MRLVNTWKIFLIIVGIVLLFIMVKVAFGDEGNQKLSREEQIQIMNDCIKSANNKSLVKLYKGEMDYGNTTERNKIAIAAAFFQYRTKDR